MASAIQPAEERFSFGIESFEGRQDRCPMIQALEFADLLFQLVAAHSR
jgi:hypothetical protein